MTDLVLMLATGLAAGVAAGVFGIGGGVIIVPALTLGFAMDAHTAVGTSLLAIVPAAAVGTAFNHRQGLVHWGTTARLVVGGLLGAVIGSTAALMLAGEALRFLFVVYLIGMGLRLVASAGPPTSRDRGAMSQEGR